jgi:8-oxo-dGTP pyrophosphatase MutT (NUDIX family)
MEADETFVDAATRELREETGLDVRPEWIEAPRWLRQIEYVYRGVCRHRRAGGRSSRS